MALAKYKKKRDFKKTTEPSGKEFTARKKTDSGQSLSSPDLAFVIQKHNASHLHYDLRLEMDGVLKSWAVPKGPSLDPAIKRLAVHVEDHPFEYRNFEGTIPEGQYGAGKVIVWDEGGYERVGGGGEKELLRDLKKGEIKIILFGQKLNGEFALVRMNQEEKNWLLIKKSDEFASKEDILKKMDSVKSKRKSNQNKTEGKKSPFLHGISPMLANQAEKPFDDPNFIYEVKWDGYRIIAEIKKGKVKLISRNGKAYTKKFEAVADALGKIKHDCVIDGEVIALDDSGQSRFQFLQDYGKNDQGSIFFYVFDLIYLDGYDLRRLPLITRKEKLKRIVSPNSLVKLSDFIVGRGIELLDLAKKSGVEGIIAKRKDSGYVSSRSDAWLKIKNILMQEAVVCGFTKPRGSRKEFGALILGIYDKNSQLQYVGHTGGGFDDEALKSVMAKLKPNITKNSPFKVAPKTNEPATWVKPKVVVQVKFSEWTKDQVMRHPVYLGIREDKKPREVVFEEQMSSQSFEFSNLDKIFWPKEGFTKGDVINYYKKIARTILPHLKDRPESLNRHPNGMNGENFFQKDMQNAPDWAKIYEEKSESQGKIIHWLICNDERTLLYMANLGCIELNPWISRSQNPDMPDYLLLDLDPHGVKFKTVVEVAKETKKLLDEIKIPAFIKTSGQVGMHIVIPLGAKYSYTQSRQFGEILAGIIRDRLPKITSVDRSPENRQKMVYIDFLQNRSGQTVAAPYSLRPFPGALVSTPLEWSELKSDLDPANFNIKTILPRLKRKGDIWADLLKHPGIDMKKSLDRLLQLAKKQA